MRSRDQVSEIMRKVKSKGTTPENLLKEALIQRGIVISGETQHLKGKPDMIIPDQKIAIFVDGDFWHGNQWKLRGLTSLEGQFSERASNRDYWIKKITRNVIRDSKVTYELFESGWVVIRLWESQIEMDINSCVDLVVNTIQNRGESEFSKLIAEKSFAEFFSGIGLMRIGLEQKGWKYKFGNDFDPEKIKMYEGHFGQDAALSSEDIHLLPVEKVPTVTLATASFPCNDLSLAGARQGLNEGRQSSAFWGFVRILREMGERRPPFILLENVTGFLSSKGGSDFRQALLTINELGYRTDTFILDAANFVPQSRKRLFIIGINQSISTPDTSAAFYNTTNTRPHALLSFIQSNPDIDWTIRPLPNQPQLKRFLQDILEDIPSDDSLWWSQERAEYLLNQMSPKHRAVADQMIAGDTVRFGTVFRRVRAKKTMAELKSDGIAGCLRTPRGGSGRQILFAAGQGKYSVRLLSPRECARLMGADDFQITGSLNQALFGFGDAVCVPAIGWIAENYLNPVVNELIHKVSTLTIGE